MGYTDRVIAFIFGGRRGNMQISMPMWRRILDEHPNVELHIWNFARNTQDHQYLQTLAGRNVTVRNELYRKRLGWQGMNIPYRHYSAPEFDNCLFVKADDDVVFLETERFGGYLDAIAGNRDHVVAAKIVNNGACTRTDPGLWAAYQALGDPVLGSASPDEPLLDVHLSNMFGDMCHNYMFDHWETLIREPIRLIPSDDWLSINMIGYDWRMQCRIAEKTGRAHSPEWIAGRQFRRGATLGDEGMVNTLPRLIMQGFLACHLTFGPQDPPDEQLFLWRKRYREIARHYLRDTTA